MRRVRARAVNEPRDGLRLSPRFLHGLSCVHHAAALGFLEMHEKQSVRQKLDKAL